MREITYNSLGTSTSLVLKLDQNDSIDSLAIGMMTNNEIQGFLPVRTRYINSEIYLYYDVSSLTPLSSAYHVLCQDKYLMHFLLSFCRLVKECDAYLLDTNKFLLSPEYFYMQMSTADAYAVYLPVADVGETATPYMFIRELVSKIGTAVPADSVIMPVLYRMVIAENTFSVDALEKQLTDLQTTGKMRQDTHGSAPIHPSAANTQPQNGFANSPVGSASVSVNQGWSGNNQQMQTPAVQTPNPVNPMQTPAEPIQTPMVQPQTEQTSGIKTEDNGFKKLFGSLSGSMTKNAGKEAPQKEKNAKGLGLGGFGAKKKTQQDDSFDFAVPDMNGAEIPQEPVSKPEPEPVGKKQPLISNPFAKPAEPVQAQPSKAQVQNDPIVQPTPAKQPAQNGAGGGYTYHLDGMDSGASLATTLMASDTDDGERKLALVRRANGQHTVITHNNFHIGRGQNMVDLYVDSKTMYIGADHAYIMMQGSEYFIIDNNSRNHTWINGEKIESSRPYPIHAGDMLRLADEYFEVVEA